MSPDSFGRLASVFVDGAPASVDDENCWERSMSNVIARKGSRITGPERAELTAEVCKKYQGGESIRALAAETGRSYGFVHGLLVDGQVPLRGRGGATRRRQSG